MLYSGSPAVGLLGERPEVLAGRRICVTLKLTS
jgi:hypothetical protein